ncbi:kinase-like protein [Cylindrobasidium torrendii FP15055 ss-10]|uniref:Kinase-like protein n=1 Tax=Cylindrobasidium torrendii FP15055 ss-10 TaxID=1314674 RepID=A0A0D7BDF1_9AGAR|nr:kinase-like protein [Cylindrobasidium torrendii FP15055 ss-10]
MADPTLLASSPRRTSLMQGTKQFIGAVEDQWEIYSDEASDYTVGAPIGFGASSIVYAATYHPPKRNPIPVALKVLDLDALHPRSLALLQKEVLTLSKSKHPNVLRVRGTWIDGHKLHIALRFMAAGSVADVIAFRGAGTGMEEEVIRCVLRQALLGMNYLHINGFIHRDIKAANLLIDTDGTVLLGDLGVAADLTTEDAPHNSAYQPGPSSPTQFRSRRGGSRDTKQVVLVDPSVSGSPTASRPKMGKRKSFVGTPSHMAPEVIQGHTYDAAADIWSFGICALEMSAGRAPRSREAPQKVLLKTVQEAAPTLDRNGGTYKYSKAFQEVVEICLVKDPSQRPNAETLLQMPFFKGAKKPSYLINTILKDLPPLTERQERRVLPSTQTRGSIDSWDFATTIHSPPASLRNSHVFDMDEEHIRVASDGNIGGKHSRAVSWVETTVFEEPEAETEDEGGDGELPSSDSDLPPSHETSPEVLASPIGTKEMEVHISPQVFSVSEHQVSLPQSGREDTHTPLQKKQSANLWTMFKRNARRRTSFGKEQETT